MKEVVHQRQILGRRLGVEAYYQLAQSDNSEEVVVRLVSHASHNRQIGLQIIIGGGVLSIFALAFLISGAVMAGQGGEFSLVALVIVLGGIFGGFGARRLIGGVAVLTTTNTIELDTQDLRFMQHDRVGGSRQQRLAREEIAGLQLRQRMLLTGGLVQRRVPIAILTVIDRANNLWLIDSAADPPSLAPAAEALAKALELEIETQSAGV